MLAVFITFPTGSLPAPRWRWPICLVTVMVVGAVLGVLLRPGAIDVGLPDNPATAALGLPALLAVLLDSLDGLGQAALGIAAVLAILALVSRFRSAGPVERQQLKLFAVAIIPTAIVLPISLVGASGDLANNLSRLRSVEGARITDLLTVVDLTLFNVAATVAILRYRLYDIDRIISRTIGYGLVSVVLFAVFGAVNLALVSSVSPLVRDEGIAVAASTLLVAALFNPLRVRVQRGVDRRFHRAHYDAERMVADFAARLRDELDLATLASELASTTTRAVQPTTAGLWLRRRGTL
jgi:hypothetical protein